MPRLWTDSIETHRRSVEDAILDAVAALAGRHGLRAVTMSAVAEEAGIGRATLYKYFADVEAILLAWHERQITSHLDLLAQVRDETIGPGDRLRAVLEAYALIAHRSRGHHDTELAALMHRGSHVVGAEGKLREMIRDLVSEAVKAGDVRDDVAPGELAKYCVYALASAADLPTKAAVRRLVEVTLSGLWDERRPAR